MSRTPNLSSRNLRQQISGTQPENGLPDNLGPGASLRYGRDDNPLSSISHSIKIHQE